MAANFTLDPSQVIPLEPEFEHIETKASGVKINYQLLGTDPILKFRLIFKATSTSNFWTIYNHYYSCYGGYDSFSWQSVPSYIDTDQDGSVDGTNLTGRWEKGSFQAVPLSNELWNIEITFVKAIS